MAPSLVNKNMYKRVLKQDKFNCNFRLYKMTSKNLIKLSLKFFKKCSQTSYMLI